MTGSYSWGQPKKKTNKPISIKIKQDVQDVKDRPCHLRENSPHSSGVCGGATQRPAAWCPHAITSSYEGVSTGTQLIVAVLLGHPGLRTGTRFSHLTSEKMKLLAPEDQSQPEEDRSDGGALPLSPRTRAPSARAHGETAAHRERRS